VKLAACIVVLALLYGCSDKAPGARTSAAGSAPARVDYFDYSGRDDALSGGVKMIPITTPKGTFHVWTKRIGNNPTMKVLLLHGGPAAGHEYMELLIPNYYTQHLLRMPADQWPDPVQRAFKHLNESIYVPMQGPSEMGASGKLEKWDRTSELSTLAMPALVIGARYDTMDPAFMEMMSKRMPHARYLYCPNGSHLAMYDDQKTYMDGVVTFIDDVNAGRF